MLTREDALNLIKTNVSQKKIVFHMIAVEAVMRRLAKYFGEDDNLWGLTGLLHDIDYEKIEGVWENHGILATKILKNMVSKKIVKAIMAHNFSLTRVTPESIMEKALIACDAISGLLVACALVMPSKKIADVKVKTVRKKFKDKNFAAGVDRERIIFCEKINVPREKFFKIALDGLKEYAEEIGL